MKIYFLKGGLCLRYFRGCKDGLDSDYFYKGFFKVECGYIYMRYVYKQMCRYRGYKGGMDKVLQVFRGR